ncbi:MAG: formylglycine-generating enzyme family protein [Treponema sp.]|nr:formylglycine-generating enzyme family protein [Treponema sp.]
MGIRRESTGGKEATFFAGSDNIDEVAWYYKYIGATIHDVMKKKPNSLGIYDMSGNVGEWCWDWSDDYNFDDTDNPKGPEKGIEKIYRGGGWDSEVWEQSFDEECSVSKHIMKTGRQFHCSAELPKKLHIFFYTQNFYGKRKHVKCKYQMK